MRSGLNQIPLPLGVVRGGISAGESARGKSPSPPPPEEGRNKQTPWAEWFRFGVGDLGLAPDEFWRLSLWEWLALVGPRPANTPTRGDLEALMLLHPDERLE